VGRRLSDASADAQAHGGIAFASDAREVQPDNGAPAFFRATRTHD
jgi:hypothetical protein